MVRPRSEADSPRSARIESGPFSDRVSWIAACSMITAIAFFLRFYWLGLKPFHHDEGVNGWFLTNLFRDGVYKYDPANYHGPTLYYISLAFAEVFGLETVPVRWSVAIWGVAIVVLAFYLRRYIGRVGALASALFLALSPGMVYISRYFIHEIFFVFLSLAIVLAVVMFMERERAGWGAIAWMALVLSAILAPLTLRLAPLLAGESTSALWAARIGLFAFAGTLIFFLIRMLLAWNGGRPIYLFLAAASTALFFATKETAFITLGTMAIACVCVWARERIAASARQNEFPTKILVMALLASVGLALILARKLPEVARDFGKWAFELTSIASADSFTTLFYMIVAGLPAGLVAAIYAWDVNATPGFGKTEEEYYRPTFADLRRGVGGSVDGWLIGAASFAIFVYLIVLFFSSFFTYADGVKGFFEAYTIWAKTSSKDHTQNGIWAYVDWGMRSDGPIMLLSFAGLVLALLKGTNRFAMFTGLWAFGLFIAYTLIPYKTPWLALSFLLPMCIAAGYVIDEAVRAKKVAVEAAGGIAALVSVIVLAYLTYDLNFVRYDDEDAPMVYAHTQREFLDMVRDIERFAAASGKGRDATIDVVSPDYWPLVWYLKDYPKALFHGRIPSSPPEAEIIVAKKGEQDRDIGRKYGSNYDLHASYELRSGVELVVMVRRDVIYEK